MTEPKPAKERKVRTGATKKEDHFWTKYENVTSELERVMTAYSFKTIPSKKQLDEAGESSLGRAIGMHGGFRKIRKSFGEKKIITKVGSWKSQEYAIARAREIMKEHGFEKLPGNKELIKLGYMNLVRAIYTHHGGYQNFRKLLGEESPYHKRGRWQSLDNCVYEVMKIMKEQGLEEVPSRRYIATFGKYGGMMSAIDQKHGGFSRFKEEVQARQGNNRSSLLESYVGEEAHEE